MAMPPKSRQWTIEPPEAVGWFNDALPEMNQFMNSTTFALDKQLTREANLASQVKTIPVDTANSPFPLTFDCTLSTAPKHLWVTQAKIVTPGGVFTGPRDASHWELVSGNKIKLYDVTGLAANTKYTITLVIE